MRSSNALLLDVGLGGAMVEHYGTVQPAERFNLTFLWHGEQIEFICEVCSTAIVKPASGNDQAVSHTGAEFVEPVGESLARLRDMIGTLVGRLLIAQKANASGEESEAAGATFLASLGEARRSRSRGYVTWRLKNGIWTSAPTQSARQPADGFTVASHEEDEDVQSLCRSYESSDEDGRNVIRVMAELSARRKD